jgi:acyl-CoA thioesterase II
VGDLGADTALHPLGEGRFEAELSPDWEIWGPMGGYVAACALRAAGAASGLPRPAALSCHYLGVARFDRVELAVVERRAGRNASSHRVEVTQEGRPILDAMVWSAGEDTEGLVHDETDPPEVPGPGDLRTLEELTSGRPRATYPFWGNLESKPIDIEADWPPPGPRPARWREWLRFSPTAAFDDPWVDAARSVILVDLPSWPSAHRPHAWSNPRFVAPSLDLHVAFQSPTAGEEWLLCDGEAPLSSEGLFAWCARVWSTGGRLHASGGGQCLYRRLPD